MNALRGEKEELTFSPALLREWEVRRPVEAMRSLAWMDSTARYSNNVLTYILCLAGPNECLSLIPLCLYRTDQLHSEYLGHAKGIVRSEPISLEFYIPQLWGLTGCKDESGYGDIKLARKATSGWGSFDSVMLVWLTFHVHQLNVERTTPPEIVSSLDPNLSFMVIYCTENSVNMGITDPIFEHVLEQQVR